MGNSSCKHAHGFHLLGMKKLGLEICLPGYIFLYSDKTVYAAVVVFDWEYGGFILDKTAVFLPVGKSSSPYPAGLDGLPQVLVKSLIMCAALKD